MKFFWCSYDVCVMYFLQYTTGRNKRFLSLIYQKMSSQASNCGQLPVQERTTCSAGLLLTNNAPFRVVSCVSGSPAERCGAIRPGDILTQIDGVSVFGRSSSSFLSLLPFEPYPSCASCHPRTYRLLPAKLHSDTPSTATSHHLGTWSCPSTTSALGHAHSYPP